MLSSARIFFMEKCISVPHERKTIFCFPSHEKKYICTEEGSEIFFTSTIKIPAPSGVDNFGYSPIQSREP